ncbi:TetR/AcrR family transcriptional regulator [Blastococcus tunisiensis]|uniref:DNA-binding transcriptional regulator, AcrR family n=1 Tax=Blastococcus tunisiensis TaxID=1798228 RepID=A0A1I2EUC3_9ACTN|nr:TetR family transcriptional regulator [Blastococcus sp. DSM 46838]SFE96734.1 DNA-binding transcriptional regulator, AcrR family [Blastococcus sp. DSM 46838]
MTEQRVYAGMSAEERTARRREQFLAAGLEVFADRGWAASTVADVCRAAALSPRYFYELFGGREDLFLAVTGRIAEQVEGTVRTVVAAPAADPQARARAVLEALAAYFTADPRTVRVALMESLATEQFRGHRRRLLESFSALAGKLMRSLWADASSGPALEIRAAVLTGGLVELLIAAASTRTPVPLDDLLDELTALYAAAARL